MKYLKMGSDVMTEDEKKDKRKAYMKEYHRQWRKKNPQKEGEYRRKVWEKKLAQEQQEQKVFPTSMSETEQQDDKKEEI